MSTLESYLTTIADAIREKKGTTELIPASNFASEILSIQGGGSLNVAYSLTPPTDTSKIWLQCAEPSGVEVQNYLGECAVSSVANWGSISNPVDSFSRFDSEYFSMCYIDNNQIAIVGYNHIRIYDLTSKKYIADYTISVGTNNYYSSNVLFKDNVLYFGYNPSLYSFDLKTQTLTTLVTLSSNSYKYLFFNSENEIDYITYKAYSGYRYRYNLTDNTNTQIYIFSSGSSYFSYMNSSQIIVKAGDYLYSFVFNGSNTTAYYCKIDLINNTVTELSSFKNFVINTLGNSNGAFISTSVIADSEERYIYLIGGGYSNVNYDNIIKYDTINDTCELLDKKLLKGKYACFSLLVDNRVYMFGGINDSSTSSSYGRRNQIDYFDLQYPLTQNNAIITTNTINTDNALPLINTEKLKINSNISSAYLGNADNLAEKVNAYYHNGYGWVGINCEDYREE